MKKVATSSPPQSERSRRSERNELHSQAPSTYTEVFSTEPSVYTISTPQRSFQTPVQTDFVTDSATAYQSGKESVHTQQEIQNQNKESVKLMPVKIKDIMEIIKNNPAYRDKSPVVVKMTEHDIDQMFEQQGNGSALKMSPSPQQSIQPSFLSSRRKQEDEQSELRFIEERSLRRSLDKKPRSLNQSYTEAISHRSARRSYDEEQSSSKPPLGGNQAPQVYAMTDIQAYPMIGTGGYRANKSSRKKAPRIKKSKTPLRSRIKKRSKSRRRSPSPRGRSRKRSRSPKRARGKSRHPKLKSKKNIIRVRSRKRSPVIVVSKHRYPRCCSPYPVCDDGCSEFPQPIYSGSRTGTMMSRNSAQCTCFMCQDKLQFIQPGICPKKKYNWTNEYAYIPKPQINLIDPCEELDPSIYPRANNPCIRDGQGNPLTDCIGRPLRDPVGKRYLNFTANGSVMDTNFRGNFYSGQPPVCVKCPLPGNSCVPDTTHSWWMSCGYPVRPNMNPYFQQVVAAENRLYR